MLRDIAGDFRLGVRQFVRAPALMSVAVLTLGLGVGATSAIFSLLDQALLERLPVPHPEQLRAIVVTSPSGATMSNVSSVFFDQLRAATSFSGVFGFWRMPMNVDTGGDVERLPVQLVSGRYYSTLGIGPLAGRLIDEADESGHRQVAVVSYGFWQRRLSGDVSILGQTLNINGTASTIIGITPPEFFGTDRGISPDVTIPLTSAPRFANLWVTARLKPEVSDEHARAEANLALGRALEIIRPSLSDYRPRDREAILGERAELAPGDKGTQLAMSAYVDPLRLLIWLAGVILVIACVNIANLLLARSIGRSREIGVRLALGARRGRIVRQLLVESLTLSTAGTLLGLALAFWLHHALVLLLMDDAAARALSFRVDSHVIAFASAVMVATLLIFGLAPAIRATEVDAQSLLQRAAPGSRGVRLGLLKGLIVVQVASAILLLFAAGLLVRTFQNVASLDTGVPVRNLVMLRLGFSQRGYPVSSQAGNHFEEIGSRIQAMPDVEAVAFGWDFAFASGTAGKSIWAEGQPPDRSQSAGFNVVGPRFFATTGIPVVAGREFLPSDSISAPKVVIINEAFARLYYPNQNPIGRHLGDQGAASVRKYEVVGMVKDTRTMFLREPVGPMLYQPLLQDTYASNVILHVRTRGDARALPDRIRSAIRAVDSKLPVYDVTTLDARHALATQRDRMMAILAAFFGVLSLLLMAIGLYGVIAYAVSQRKTEIGLRLALGATSGQVRTMVLRETLTLVGAGAAIGIPVSFVAARVLRAALFDVSPQDPVTTLGCVFVLLAAGGVAGYLPAHRAANLEPMAALRHD